VLILNPANPQGFSTQPITVVPTYISISSKVPQILESTPTNPISVARLSKHRASIQTTVDELRDLMERFRVLIFDGRDQFFHAVIANILPIT
jgi:hypothetical protein